MGFSILTSGAFDFGSDRRTELSICFLDYGPYLSTTATALSNNIQLGFRISINTDLVFLQTNSGDMSTRETSPYRVGELKSAIFSSTFSGCWSKRRLTKLLGLFDEASEDPR